MVRIIGLGLIVVASVLAAALPAEACGRRGGRRGCSPRLFHRADGRCGAGTYWGGCGGGCDNGVCR